MTRQQHDGARNGTAATLAGGQADGGGIPSTAPSVVAVKVEEKQGGVAGGNASCNGSNGSADGEVRGFALRRQGLG